jgi:hypothetical protein
MSRFVKPVFWAGLLCLIALLVFAVWRSMGEKGKGPSPEKEPRGTIESVPTSLAQWLTGTRAAKKQKANTQRGMDAWEVEEAVRAIFAAYNRTDVEAFLAGWTDKGFQEMFRETKERVKRTFPRLRSVGVGPFTVGEFSNTVLRTRSATTEVELTKEQQRKMHRFSLVNEGNVWKIDGDEELTADVPIEAPVIALIMTEFALEVDTREISKRIAFGKVALKVSNGGQRPHQLVVMKWLPESETERSIGRTGPLKPGEEKILVLTDLEAGRYAMLCNLVDSDGTPYSSKGMRAEFTVE